MPPQPLSRVNRKAQVTYGPATATTYPNLCAIVMEVISLGAQADFNWSAILVDMLRADFKTGMAMYEALAGGEARRAALMGAAQSAFSPEDFLLLQAMEKAFAPTRRVRNDFAHHIWGRSIHVPNALLLIDPRCLRTFEVGVAMTNAEMARTRMAKVPPDFDRSLIAVWREPDLAQAREAMIEALKCLGLLAGGLSFARPRIRIPELERKKLLSYPAIARALQRLSPKRTPQVLKKSRAKARPAER